MSEREAEGEKRGSGLSAALRQARIDDAERTQVLGDLRNAELARLDLLREMLEPVLSQIPSEAELFDIGVVPGEHPRLFVDMIAFVEMDRDRRTYRFLQDRRDGRVLLAETDSVGTMLRALTAYIARRLVEREKLLAGLPPTWSGDGNASPARASDPPPPASRNPGSGLGRALRLLLDGLGMAALGGLIWLGVLYAQGRVPSW